MANHEILLDNLDDAVSSLAVRIGLQADLTWSAAQGGYYDGNLYDEANPFGLVVWDLEPMAMHCSDCPEIASGSPYGPPGSGRNELLQTPGDGNTQCGAGCRCSLRYVGMGEGPALDGATIGNILPRGIPGLDNLGDDMSIPLPQGDLNDRQKDGLDGIRRGIRLWERVRGDLPSLPSPFLAESAMAMPEWDDLTDAQQEALEAYFNGLVSWSVATNLANLDSGPTSLTERHRAILLYNPYHDERGRFTGPGGGGGGGEDVHGQHMPFTHAEFEAARASGHEVSQPGSVNGVTKLTINGHEYYAKVRQGDDGGKGALAAEMARNEAATVAALHALGMGDLGPEAAYHVVDSQGRHYAVVRTVPGKDADDYDEAAIAQHVSSEHLARLTLAEYLTGMMDRHGGNLQYDEATHHLREIDFGWGMKPHAGLGDYEAPRGRLMMVARTKAQSIWSMQRGTQRFPRAMVEETLRHAEHIGHALDHFGLKDTERAAFDERVRVVRKWLESNPGDPTLDELERTIRQEGHA